jgi:hypothetical protein
MRHRIALALALLVAAGAACSKDEKPQTAEKFVHDLKPGDCLNGTATAPRNAKKGEVNALVVASLPCSAAHEKEVFAVFDYPGKAGGPFPGENVVAKAAQDGCADRFAAYVGQPFGDSDLRVAVIAPGPLLWDKNERTIVCTLQGNNKLLKGSKKVGG